MPRESWKKEEEQFLKGNYKELTRPELADKMNRAKSSVANKIYRLGLKKGHLGLRGKRNPFYGKHHTEETKGKIRNSEYHRNLKGENHPNYGKLLAWTKEEEGYLKENCTKLSDKEIADKLGKTASAVRHKRQRITNVRRKKSWTNEEKEFLMKYYCKKGAKWCSEKLGRSCRTKARKIGLKIREPMNIPQKDFKKDSFELGYVLGTLCGDGWIYISSNNYSISLSVARETHRDSFADILERWSGIKPCHTKRVRKFGMKKCIAYDVSLNSKIVCLWIDKIGKYKTKEWRVPEKVENGNIEIKVGFLSGLYDSDGTNDSRNSIHIRCTNYNGLKDVDKMMNELGCMTKFSPQRSQITHIHGKEYKTNIYKLTIWGSKEYPNLLKSQIPCKITRLDTWRAHD